MQWRGPKDPISENISTMRVWLDSLGHCLTVGNSLYARHPWTPSHRPWPDKDRSRHLNETPIRSQDYSINQRGYRWDNQTELQVRRLSVILGCFSRKHQHPMNTGGPRHRHVSIDSVSDHRALYGFEPQLIQTPVIMLALGFPQIFVGLTPVVASNRAR